MSYTVIARRYRPRDFSEVVGQEHVATTLKNAILEGRVGHAYIFSGPRGVGKTSMARILARALNCEKGPTETPCLTCSICTAIGEGSESDVIEIDAASNRGIEDARELRESVQYAPLRCRTKVYIIDEAHMLTREAFNALLKTLEEPPPHVKFIFATTEPHKLPDTITSRCQRFDFKRITREGVVARLKEIAKKEKAKVSDSVLAIVAGAGGGSMRDAQSVFEQVLSFTTGKISEEDVHRVMGTVAIDRLGAIARAILDNDAHGVLVQLDEVSTEGKDLSTFTEQLIGFWRDILLLQTCGAEERFVEIPEDHRPIYIGISDRLGTTASLHFVELLIEARRSMREGQSSRVVLELALVKMARSSGLGDLQGLLERVEKLEAALKDGASAGPRVVRVKAGPRPERPESAPSRTEPVRVVAKDEDDVEEVPVEKPEKAPREKKKVASGGGGGADEWSRVLTMVNDERKTVGGLLREGELENVDGNAITIAFDPQWSFHVKQLETAAMREVIEGAAEKVFGRAMSVKLMLRGSGGALESNKEEEKASPGKKKSRPDPDTRTREISSDPTVQRILDAFQGRITGVQE